MVPHRDSAYHEGVPAPDKPTPLAPPVEVSAQKPLTLPYDPILSAMKSPDHAKRAIKGILESYNSNYDAFGALQK